MGQNNGGCFSGGKSLILQHERTELSFSSCRSRFCSVGLYTLLQLAKYIWRRPPSKSCDLTGNQSCGRYKGKAREGLFMYKCSRGAHSWRAWLLVHEGRDDSKQWSYRFKIHASDCFAMCAHPKGPSTDNATDPSRLDSISENQPSSFFLGPSTYQEARRLGDCHFSSSLRLDLAETVCGGMIPLSMFPNQR